MFVCTKCGAENYPGISYFERAKEPNRIWITCHDCGTFGVHPYEGAQSLDLKSLKTQGLGVVDTLRFGVEKSLDAFRGFVVRPIPEGETDRFYVELIAKLANTKLNEKQAQEAWLEILDHKWYLSEKAERDVGIQVSALDFFKNIWPSRDERKKPAGE